MTFDPRLTPARPDLAAAHLEGTVEAARFVEGKAMTVTAPVLDMTGAPDREVGLTNQLIHGEGFTAYEIDPATGYAWGQSETDGYVGYVPASGLKSGKAAATAQVVARSAQVYASAELKVQPLMTLPFLARLEVAGAAGDHARLEDGRFVPAPQVGGLAPMGDDYVAVAERFLGVAYLWGGRSIFGLDCSGLVQLAMMAIGREAPRDSDQQTAIGADVDGPLARGDLVFWKGHVGIMLDETRLLHANAFHMAVAIEPLAETEARILASDGGPVTGRRRP